MVTKIALGEADVGFAYVSDITEELSSKVEKVEIPDEYNVIAEYPMGILKESKYPAQSEEFMNLVKSEQGRAILEKYGFAPVDDSAGITAVRLHAISPWRPPEIRSVPCFGCKAGDTPALCSPNRNQSGANNI